MNNFFDYKIQIPFSSIDTYEYGLYISNTMSDEELESLLYGVGCGNVEELLTLFEIVVSNNNNPYIHNLLRNIQIILNNHIRSDDNGTIQ